MNCSFKSAYFPVKSFDLDSLYNRISAAQQSVAVVSPPAPFLCPLCDFNQNAHKQTMSHQQLSPRFSRPTNPTPPGASPPFFFCFVPSSPRRPLFPLVLHCVTTHPQYTGQKEKQATLFPLSLLHSLFSQITKQVGQKTVNCLETQYGLHPEDYTVNSLH